MSLRGRWAVAVLVALVLSLAGNLFAAGFLAGRGLRGPVPSHAYLQGFLASVPAAARPLVRQALRDHRPAVRARLDALRDARGTAFAALRAPQVDEAALAAALARVRETTTAAQLLVDQVLTQTASRLPAEQRAGWGASPTHEEWHP